MLAPAAIGTVVARVGMRLVSELPLLVIKRSGLPRIRRLTKQASTASAQDSARCSLRRSCLAWPGGDRGQQWPGALPAGRVAVTGAGSPCSGSLARSSTATAWVGMSLRTATAAECARRGRSSRALLESARSSVGTRSMSRRSWSMYLRRHVTCRALPDCAAQGCEISGDDMHRRFLVKSGLAGLWQGSDPSDSRGKSPCASTSATSRTGRWPTTS